MVQAKNSIYFCSDLVMKKANETESYARDMQQIMKKHHRKNWPDKFYISKLHTYSTLDKILPYILNTIEQTVGDNIVDPDTCVLVFGAISDFSPHQSTSLRALHLLDHLGYTIFITSLSLDEPFDYYAEPLCSIFHAYEHKPRSRFPEDLLEYVADLRGSQEWTYKTLEEKSGIPRHTLIKYMHRTNATGLLHDGVYGKSESIYNEFGRKEEDTILFLKYGMNKKDAQKWADIYDKKHNHDMRPQ